MSVTARRGMSAKLSDLARPMSPATALGALLLTIVVIGGLYLYEGHIGLDVADEGWLWYGAWRTLLGEVPFRDFDSYDPGRYYWAAAWLALLGNDLLVLRLSGAVLHAAALLTAMALLRRVTRNPWLLAVAAVVLACWLFHVTGRSSRASPCSARTRRRWSQNLPPLDVWAWLGWSWDLRVRGAQPRPLLDGGVPRPARMAQWTGRRAGARGPRRDVRDRRRHRVRAHACVDRLRPRVRARVADIFHTIFRNDPLPWWWTWQELGSGVPLVNR